MGIAVVGATGRIGATLTRTLLAQGHAVRALSRGGGGLDALVADGAEPFIGSFDTGDGDLAAFFDAADAAFLMVKTDWDNIESHYATVAQRLVDALAGSPVRLAVNLSAMGAEIAGETGHFKLFHELEQTLDTLRDIDLVHLRAGWFMENTLAWTDAVARYRRIAWYYEPDLKMPWVAAADIAGLATTELTGPRSGHRVVREAGSHELSMREVAAIIGRAIDAPVDYRMIDRRDAAIEATYLARFGTPTQWRDDDHTADAMNSGLIHLHGHARTRPPLPTTMEDFVRTTWKPGFVAAMQASDTPETFLSWSARPR